MRMIMRTEECRRRAAECAERALCTVDQEARRTFAELAEQWRALALHSEYLERYHRKTAVDRVPRRMASAGALAAKAARGIASRGISALATSPN